MPEVTYDAIKPLIAKEELQGSTMNCTFKCPVSGTSVDSTATVQVNRSVARNVAGEVKQSVKRSLFWQLQMALSRFIGRLLGGGTGGYIAQQAAYSATAGVGRSTMTSSSYTSAEKRAAVVAAFQQVADRFTWDEAAKRWVAAGGEQ